MRECVCVFSFCQFRERVVVVVSSGVCYVVVQFVFFVRVIELFFYYFLVLCYNLLN